MGFKETVMMKIILASSSKPREKLLRSLGLSFQVVPHRVDEQAYKNKISDPGLLCRTLARAKALSVQQKNFYVIGADQMAVFNGKAFGKPKTKEKAFEVLSLFQGKTHELATGFYLQKPDGSFFEDLIISRMTMRSLTKKQIESYLEKDEPYQCAGSYTIERLGVGLFKKIETPDFTAVIGLPLLCLCSQIPFLE